ncbi:MAG: lytic murein transglycosylase B [Rhodocyclaceae bacterium]
MIHRFARRLIAIACICATLPAAAQSESQPYTERDDVRIFMADVATRNDIPIEEVAAALSQAQRIPKVIDYIKPPTQPGARSWQRYRERFLDKVRINGGVQFWQQNAVTLARAEAKYGVPAEVIVAIIGVETIYGRNTGNFSTLSALATLAFDYPPRADLFRRELEALILLSREQGREITDYKGSYAGALGLPQFLPSSERGFAVDFDDDGHIDLLTSPSDAIGSVANFLVQHGWEKGGPIATRAMVAQGANVGPLLEAGILPQFKQEDFARQGVRPVDNAAPDAAAALIDLVTPGAATEFWLGYQNFYVITRYNHSSFYAMSVMALADAVKTAYLGRTAQGTAN